MIRVIEMAKRSPIPQTILCALDFSPHSRAAARISVDLARRFDAFLFIFHAVCTPSSQVYGTPVSERGRSQERQARHAREALENIMVGADVSWEPVIVFSDPVEQLVETAKNRGADLVIAASYGIKGVQRMLHGTVVERMVRGLDRPFLVVPADRPVPSKEAFCVSRILAACDVGDDVSDGMIACALEWANAFDAHLDMFHALEFPGNGGLAGDGPTGHYAEIEAAFMEKRRRQILDRIPLEKREQQSLSITLGSGVPGESLIDCALSLGVDLIIVGVRPRRFWGRVFKGSTTETVLRNAPCPVLAVPDKGWRRWNG